MTVDLPLLAGDRHVLEWATPAMARLTAGKRNMTLEQLSNVNYYNKSPAVYKLSQVTCRSLIKLKLHRNTNGEKSCLPSERAQKSHAAGFLVMFKFQTLNSQRFATKTCCNDAKRRLL